jgi:hypothetical protein
MFRPLEAIFRVVLEDYKIIYKLHLLETRSHFFHDMYTAVGRDSSVGICWNASLGYVMLGGIWVCEVYTDVRTRTLNCVLGSVPGHGSKME